MARRTHLIAYLATYLVAIGSAIRYLDRFRDDGFWTLALLIAGYLILLIAEPLVFRQHRPLVIIYLVVQAAIIGALALQAPEVDFWAALLLPIILQVMNDFSQRTGFLITGLLTLLMAILMLVGVGPEVGLPLILINGVIFFFLAAFIAIVRDAETARLEANASRKEAEIAREDAEKQKDELQSAYRQLQSYTAQAEELAVLHERNRLARNLHDSVTQTIFSMRLTAEAARMLLDREPGRVGEELDKLQSLAKSALAEMRSMVFELRPTAVAELGLVPALQHLIITLQRQFGLTVNLQVTGEAHLTELEAQRLFRISQEALNNVVKHAHTDKACLTIRFDEERVFLQVEDQGIGFDPAAQGATGDHIGLASLQERVGAMGGLLAIESQPGQGTRVTVEIESAGEEEGDG